MFLAALQKYDLPQKYDWKYIYFLKKLVIIIRLQIYFLVFLIIYNLHRNSKNDLKSVLRNM